MLPSLQSFSGHGYSADTRSWGLLRLGGSILSPTPRPSISFYRASYHGRTLPRFCGDRIGERESSQNGDILPSYGCLLLRNPSERTILSTSDRRATGIIFAKLPFILRDMMEVEKDAMRWRRQKNLFWLRVRSTGRLPLRDVRGRQQLAFDFQESDDFRPGY